MDSEIHANDMIDDDDLMVDDDELVELEAIVIDEIDEHDDEIVDFEMDDRTPMVMAYQILMILVLWYQKIIME
jgi:hypothetical protein